MMFNRLLALKSVKDISFVDESIIVNTKPKGLDVAFVKLTEVGCATTEIQQLSTETGPFDLALTKILNYSFIGLSKLMVKTLITVIRRFVNITDSTVTVQDGRLQMKAKNGDVYIAMFREEITPDLLQVRHSHIQLSGALRDISKEIDTKIKTISTIYIDPNWPRGADNITNSISGHIQISPALEAISENDLRLHFNDSDIVKVLNLIDKYLPHEIEIECFINTLTDEVIIHFIDNHIDGALAIFIIPQTREPEENISVMDICESIKSPVARSAVAYMDVCSRLENIAEDLRITPRGFTAKIDGAIWHLESHQLFSDGAMTGHNSNLSVIDSDTILMLVDKFDVEVTLMLRMILDDYGCSNVVITGKYIQFELVVSGNLQFITIGIEK